MTVTLLNDVLWQYTVSITNRTPEVLDQILLLYRNKASQLAYLEHNDVQIGETRVFQLGICPDMESYSFSVFIKGVEVSWLPPREGDLDYAEWGPGPVTREKASLHNPTDKFLCEDSWSVG